MRNEALSLRFERSQVGRNCQDVGFIQILHDGTHQLCPRAVASELLDIVELAREIAGRTASNPWHGAQALQIRAVAVRAGNRFPAATIDQDLGEVVLGSGVVGRSPGAQQSLLDLRQQSHHDRR